MLVSAAFALIGALAHLAVPLGGPSAYALLGAPRGLVAMAQAGSLRPLLTCVAIAAVLLLFGLYALSGLGRIRRLPLLRLGLAAIGTGLIVRGVAFIPLALWHPRLLSGLCGRCDGVNSFVVITSVLCLVAGIGFLLGATVPPTSRAAHTP